MPHALETAVAQAKALPLAEQDALAAILLAEVESEQRWSQTLGRSQDVLEALAAEAISEFKSGKTKPLGDLR